MEKLIKKAEKMEPSITGWDHEGRPGFIYAQYAGPLGKIVGINLDKKRIVETN